MDGYPPGDPRWKQMKTLSDKEIGNPKALDEPVCKSKDVKDSINRIIEKQSLAIDNLDYTGKDLIKIIIDEVGPKLTMKTNKVDPNNKPVQMSTQCSRCKKFFPYGEIVIVDKKKVCEACANNNKEKKDELEKI